MLWVLTTIIAAAAQTGRNAAQSGLTRTIGTLGATQVRFLFGLPFALAFLALAPQITGQPIPLPGARSLLFTTFGALAQIGGTALMLVVMKSQNFAVTTAWLKAEPVLVALASALILGDPLTGPMLGAIGLATLGVLILTVRPGTQGWGDARALGTGIASAGLFAISAIGFRGGILALDQGGYLTRATTILALSLTLQTAILLVWLTLFNRPALMGSFGVWRSSLVAGFLGAFASEFWFLGFSMTSAANVRTLALVDLIFAQVVSRFWLGQKTTMRQIVGMAVVLAGVAALMRVQAG